VVDKLLGTKDHESEEPLMLGVLEVDDRERPETRTHFPTFRRRWASLVSQPKTKRESDWGLTQKADR